MGRGIGRGLAKTFSPAARKADRRRRTDLAIVPLILKQGLTENADFLADIADDHPYTVEALEALGVTFPSIPLEQRRHERS